MKYFFYIIAFTLFFGCNNKKRSPGSGGTIPEITILTQPQPVIINGEILLNYELQLVNTWADTSIITRIEIYDHDHPGLTYFYEGDELLSHLHKNGSKSSNTRIAKADTAIFYIDLEIRGNKVPKFLSHSIFCVPAGNDTGQPGISQDFSLALEEKKAIVLGQPLSGGPWAAVYDFSWERGHRRVVYSPDGVKRIPGRYAIDFIKMDTSGHYAKGDEEAITNWYGYAANVYAVADGTVASTRDDFKESATLAAHPHYSSDSATGNYISIKIADSQFVFYEHLKPGSILVKPGQQVKKGDIIAKLGFTGQTTGPHLHLHVADTDSPLAAEGLAFVFEEFISVGVYSDFNDFGKAKWKEHSAKGVIKNERPASNAIINFPAPASLRIPK